MNMLIVACYFKHMKFIQKLNGSTYWGGGVNKLQGLKKKFGR